MAWLNVVCLPSNLSTQIARPTGAGELSPFGAVFSSAYTEVPPGR